ncbi:FxSxx-COOH system tetratricopeptide repeat protein [Streptacidiphilus anmyonensis]|uniref:FxSxx-COOH system tetratricopeptide repeat protein n=1 Tax=Streptacidiphilus anmyonensis TaxID=405782 RepID=UPI000694C6FA|nr:FxSxx-COOH system tetratricopeptide repeat protein [Streptacidiphilus anmyonensis]
MTAGDGPTGRGKVVTFYSYKGGTGRTTALANVAWILAADGLRVLAVDWDLEAPGLERYFHPFLDPVERANRTGVLDAVTDFRAALDRYRWSGTELRQLTPRHADVSGRVLRVDWPHFPGRGRLDLLCAGQEGPAYAEALADLDWNLFYSRDHGADFLQALRDSMAAAYDYVLIDSRTGLGDVAGVCTLELPDTLVVCFTLSGQGIDGAAGVAHDVARVRAGQGRPVRVLPVPTRVDGGEHERFEAGRDLARRRFAGFPEGVEGEALRAYWNAAALPYRAYYAFEEVLAVFGDEPGDPQSLLAGCERLTAAVTGGAVRGLPPMPPALRAAWRDRYQRRRTAPAPVALLHGTAERAWAQWAKEVLESAGLQVRAHEFAAPPRLTAAPGPDPRRPSHPPVASGSLPAPTAKPGRSRDTDPAPSPDAHRPSDPPDALRPTPPLDPAHGPDSAPGRDRATGLDVKPASDPGRAPGLSSAPVRDARRASDPTPASGPPPASSPALDPAPGPAVDSAPALGLDSAPGWDRAPGPAPAPALDPAPALGQDLAPGREPGAALLAGAQRVVALLSEPPWAGGAEQLLRGLEGRTGPDGQPLLLRVRCGGESRSGRELDLRQPDEQLAARMLVRAVDPDLAVDESPVARTARFPGRAPSVWNAPGRNPFFTGRAEELERTHELLAVRGRVALLAERPGAGATELAREFAHRYRGDYDLVWWIPAADPAAARAAYHLLLPAGREGLPARSLLVLDGADDPEALDWQSFGPPGVPGTPAHVLVTTALPVWGEHAELLPVGRLDRPAARRLLGRPDAAPGSAVDRLAARLADHAPALFLASAYLAVSGETPQTLLLSLDPADPADPVQAVLARTLDLLEARSPAALRVLQLCACLGGGTVARRLLRDDRLLRELEELRPDVMDWASFAIVQGELETLGLLFVDGGGELLRIDARVAASALARLGPVESEGTVRRAHALLVARRLRIGADVDEERNWRRLEEVWRHLLPSGADAADEPEVRDLFVDFVRYLWCRGRPVEAEQLAEVLDARWSARLPEHDWRRLRLRAEWANSLRSQGRHLEAHRLDEATMAAQRQLFGAEHVHTLITAGGYGGDLRALGRYQEALEVDRRTLAAMTARLGRTHMRTQRMINNLGLDHHLVGDYAEALELHEEALRIRLVAPGPAHPATLDSAAAVARAVRELGRPGEALERLQRVWSAVSAAPDLPSRFRVGRELAAALRGCGRHREALELAAEVHAAAVRRGGEGSPAAQACLLELAAGWHVTGARERAVPAAARVRAWTAERTGADHPEALCCAHNHAVFVAGDGRDRGHAAEALALLSPVVRALELRLGPTHPLTLSARGNRVGLLAVVGETTSALSEGRGVLGDANARQGVDHPLSLLLAANLGNVGQRAGRPLESEGLRIEALPRLSRLLGRDHPDLSTLRQGRWVGMLLDIPVW